MVKSIYKSNKNLYNLFKYLYCLAFLLKQIKTKGVMKVSYIENKNAFFLIDDNPTSNYPYTTTNWDVDFRGAGRAFGAEDVNPKKRILSVLDRYPTIFKRDITEQFSGKLTFETIYEIVSGDGFYICFKNQDAEAFKMTQQGDAFYAGDKKLFSVGAGEHYIKVTLDIDTGKVVVRSDGKWAAECTFTGSAESISTVALGYDALDIGETLVSMYVKMYKNYLVNDMVINYNEGDMPDDFIVEKNGKSKASRSRYQDRNYLFCVYQIDAKKDSETTVTKSFARTKGKICFQIRYFLPSQCSKATIGMYGADECAVSVCDEGTAIYNKDGVLRNHSYNVWQTLRFEADTESQTATVYLNCKKVTTIAFENNVTTIDSIKINFEAQKAAKMGFVDLYVYEMQPEPADYVPAPVVPKKKGDYYIGMNICSLWRAGQYLGWDCITPYDEIKPVLGFYDEGMPEVSDWEIKFMAEHGVDCQFYCWYPTIEDRPMKWASHEDAMIYGHMHAKYGDKVKLALLWEAGGARPRNLDEFKKHYVPYWMDYLFCDDKYFVIDNKPVMAIYALNLLVRDMGGTAVVRQCMDYLRKEIKKLGYDDMIILACSRNSAECKECGIDAVYAYNWGIPGKSGEFNKQCILGDMESGYVHTVPTVSVGFNKVGWGTRRTGLMPNEEFRETLEWCRDEILTQHDKDSWKSKLLMLSTWNEYGEGTYIMPSGGNGFGYLDAVRNVFTEDIPHTDVVPNENQKSRINILHPKDRQKLSAYDLMQDLVDGYGVYKRYEFKTQKDIGLWDFEKLSVEIKDGMLYGHSEEMDPYMILKDKTFFGVESGKISAIRIKMRAGKEKNRVCMTTFGFSTDASDDNANISINADSREIQTYIIDLHSSGILWSKKDYPFGGIKCDGNITGFRLDPIFAKGDFEIEYIEFLEAPRHKDIYINDELMDTFHYTAEFDGETFVPFDTNRPITKQPKMYYEWHKPEQQLVIWTDNKYVLTKGSDVAYCDGEEFKLSRPLEFIDGLPFISAKLYAKILGYSYKETDDKVIYKTND